ncbi:MAG: porin, partial [Colwellia sp.]|nr:porin [Colwellia sp.]
RGSDPRQGRAASGAPAPCRQQPTDHRQRADAEREESAVNGMSQSSEDAGVDNDQSGVGYGVNVKVAGVSLTASGFTAEGLGHVVGLDQYVGAETIDTDGYLVQASYTMGDNRFVVSYGQSTVDDSAMEIESSNTNISYFRTVIPGVTLVAELNKTEIENNVNTDGEENDVFSIGAVVTF